MTTTAASRRRVWVISGLAAAVAATGGVLLFTHALAESPKEGNGAGTATVPGAEAPRGSPSGPARLHDRARQVSDPDTARRLAEDALARVDAELAAATEAGEFERLKRKRTLIVEAMNRLTATEGR
ncbi:MAG: hypothetical protein HY907_16805 [Deltaproteobacteria bacterium]|nr:hypothetical protein [Deltaproteobacteria bacterium]